MSNSRIKLTVEDHNFYAMPDDVLRQFNNLQTALKAGAMLLQRKVQMRIPTEEGLVPRNVVVVMKKRSANVELVPIRPRKKDKPVFNPWTNDIEYKKKPFMRPAFDETENEIVEIFNMALGRIK